jgi:hypothetical protein
MRRGVSERVARRIALDACRNGRDSGRFGLEGWMEPKSTSRMAILGSDLMGLEEMA